MFRKKGVHTNLWQPQFCQPCYWNFQRYAQICRDESYCNQNGKDAFCRVHWTSKVGSIRLMRPLGHLRWLNNPYLHHYFNLHVRLYFRRRGRRRPHLEIFLGSWQTNISFAPPEGLASPRSGDPSNQLKSLLRFKKISTPLAMIWGMFFIIRESW